MNEKKKGQNPGFIQGLFSFEFMITPQYIKILHILTSIISSIVLFFSMVMFGSDYGRFSLTGLFLWILVSFLVVLISKIRSESLIIRFMQHEELVKIRRKIEEDKNSNDTIEFEEIQIEDFED